MSPVAGGGRPTAYRLADGTKVPGTTTIIGRFKESGGLIWWAWDMGRQGKDYRQERDRAANAGAIAHELIDAFVHDREAVIPSAEELAVTPEQREAMIVKARNAFAQFLEWHGQTKLEILSTETPFVSERHRFGGTIDAVGRINGTLAILDWKSSNRIYADYICQVSAYKTLWEENHPGDVIERIHLLRIDKDADGFHHHSWGPETLAKGLRAFVLMRELWDIDVDLKKAAA